MGLCISCSSLPGRVNWESDHSWSCCPVLSGPSSGRPGSLTADRPSGNFLPRPSIPSLHPAGGEERCTAQGPGPTPGTQSFLITFPLSPGFRRQSLFPGWECSHTPSPNLGPFSSLACPQNQGLIFISLPSSFKFGQFLI